MKHAIHPEADAEFAEAVRYYTNIDPKLGARFYREIERLIQAVCAQPERFFQINPPARRALSHEFPYSVVYLEQPDRIWIVAVMHVKSRPGTGNNALPENPTSGTSRNESNALPFVHWKLHSPVRAGMARLEVSMQSELGSLKSRFFDCFRAAGKTS